MPPKPLPHIKPVGFLDKALSPFHTMSFTLTFISTLSLHAVFVEIVGPIKSVLVVFLITFPFTLGLTIIFLVLYNYKWQKLNGSAIISGLAMFTLLFLILKGISDHFDLQHIATELTKKEKQTTAAFDPFKAPVSIKQNLDSFANSVKDFSTAPPPQPWYTKIPVLPALIGTIANFYIVYRPAGFFSAIALALFFAYYIQKLLDKAKRDIVETSGVNDLIKDND